jgi:hypothetical protein
MAEPFSLVASSFAVVGLAYGVLWAGKECCQFLNAIKDAPIEVKQFQCSNHDNILLVEDSKRYWDDLKESASLTSSTTTALNRAFPQFKSSLRALDRELVAFATFTKRHNGNIKSWGRIKWVLDERKILKYLQKFEASKSTLVAALVLVGD